MYGYVYPDQLLPEHGRRFRIFANLIHTWPATPAIELVIESVSFATGIILNTRSASLLMFVLAIGQLLVKAGKMYAFCGTELCFKVFVGN